MLDIDLRREELFRGNFLCNISIYSILTFEPWSMRGSFYVSFPNADFPGMKVPAGAGK